MKRRGFKSGGQGNQVRPETGIAWYRADQWPRLLQVSTDRSELADTYEGWLSTAEKALSEMESAGIRVHRVDVDVEELLAWCSAKGRPVDGPARAEFVAYKLREGGKENPS